MQPIVVINTVGLTTRHLEHAPRLSKLAREGWSRPLGEVVPAVTCSAQATMLTGKLPSEHGVVGNGWLFRDTREVRFWQQSSSLVQSEFVYDTARRLATHQGKPFRCAKVFWWFNQGARVDVSVTPKPHYGADGNKAFDIRTYPEDWAMRLTGRLGPFPFPTFWGPKAGLACSQWIARAAAEVLDDPSGPPTLTLVYLPHLDYDTQRLGPSGCDWRKIVGELDNACARLLEQAKAKGARVWIVNEYAHLDVDTPIYLNRVLRQAGLLKVRGGPFGEHLETFESEAFAVCDHQLAHIYVRNQTEIRRVLDSLVGVPGIDRLYVGDERREIGLDHVRSGEIVAISKPNAWFAYPFWLDDRLAPDYSRTVDIHRKPGYDPCELFFDPKLLWPMGKALRRLIAKKLGFRTLFDVIPLDARLVRGSHGRVVESLLDKPVIIADGIPPSQPVVPQSAIFSRLLEALDLPPT